MASTLVDLEHAPYRNEGFCAALELAVAAARELGPVPGARDAGLDERVQRQAILRLRSGATANPGLLPLLAEGRFAALGAAVPGADEVSRALAVPDLFLLTAPPGTTRTMAVVEIVRSAAERGERVLLTAPATPAVEVLLARLPAGATVLRLDAGADHAGAGPGSLAAAAAGVQQRILARSQSAVHALDPWLGEPSPAMGWLRRLTTALAEAAEARERADRAAAHHDAAARAARNRLGAPLRERALLLEAAGRAVAQTAGQVDLLAAAMRRAEATWLRRWQINGLRHRLGEAVRLAAAARSASHQAHAAYDESAHLLTQEVEQDATVRAAADRAAFAEVAAERALESAERSAHHLTRLLDGVADVPGWTADAESLAGLAGRCHELEPVLRGRAGLLREWRQRAARPTRQLHAELLRYADVVATTCLGAGRPEHGDLEFDLLVMEDACQVPVPAALVPMVRARRAVLVGESRRPPLRDAEVVRAWLAARCPAGADAGVLSGLLTGSVFERVEVLAPAGNRAVTGW
ncbi:AAA domain-containing protein [Actinoplanes sp. NEAU-A12]|uniref:AAA domain-containing protein n=1 Tax=Actinoplanes sandaracinus TaxID=3045177 RepID=A0ABT6WMT6_9ACTN|nr:AAA domain-containing protein [Actinoplanes sandaracinus]MDI6101038.1 AAA domain-containing protein [Actinoplanes sandaracinus]